MILGLPQPFFKGKALGTRLSACNALKFFYYRILKTEALVYNSYIFFPIAVLWKLFDIRFSYTHCNFSRVCLPVKMALKTVTSPLSKPLHAYQELSNASPPSEWKYKFLNQVRSNSLLLLLRDWEKSLIQSL